MIRLRLARGLTFLMTTAACTALTVTGCSDPGGSAAENAAEESPGDLHAEEDPSLPPPNDDPSLGEELDVDTGAAEDEAEAAAAEPSDDLEVGSTALALTRIASPVPGKRVTYPFGVRNSRYAAGYHTGNDYAAPVGRRVVAVRSGRIRWSNNNGGAYGKWIGLDADNGRTYVYCHLSSRLVRAGTRVVAGKLLGRVGATGNVTGPHLHFEDHPRGPFVYARVRRPSW